MFAVSEASYQDMVDELSYQPNTIADDHRDYHTYNGYEYGCPWDCAASDTEPDQDGFSIELFSPGFCAGREFPVVGVPSCTCHQDDIPF